MACFTSGLFLALRWWVSAIPMLAMSVACFVEMLLDQAPAVVMSVALSLAAMGSAALEQGWPVAATLGLLAAAACIGVIASETWSSPAARRPPTARVEAPMEGPPPPAAQSFAGAAAGAASDDDGEEGLATGWGHDWMSGMAAPPPGGAAQHPAGQWPIHAALQGFAAGHQPSGPYSHTFAQQMAGAPPMASPPGQWQPPMPFAPGPSGAQWGALLAGLSQEELQHMTTSDQWTGIGSSVRRAAPEIYWAIRQAGHANVREWWQAVWGSGPPTQQRMDLWHTATTLDLRVKVFSDRGPQALAWGLLHDDLLEGLLRQLAAAKEYHLTH